MTEYRAKETCFLNGSRVRQGAIVSLPDGVAPPAFLVPLSDAKPEAQKRVLKAEHQGNGRWQVKDDKGVVVESGLTKFEAQALAVEGA